MVSFLKYCLVEEVEEVERVEGGLRCPEHATP